MPAKYTPEQRITEFWNKVAIAGEDDCWLWKGACIKKGYGQVGWFDRLELAHRVSYELSTGKAPGELFVLHKCDNRRCCNPAHLFLGTNTDNMRDMEQKGRGVHLKGERHVNHKLTDAQVVEIRQRYASGSETLSALGREYGVSNVQIGQIVHNKQRKDVPNAF